MLDASFSRSSLRLALLAGAFGVVAASASAQGYGPYDPRTPYSAGPTESVEVIAPRFRADSTPLNGPLEKISLSSAVRYDDLDLTTREGARALRRRVYREAVEVCDRIAEAYPVYEMTSATPCYKSAISNAMVKADGAITDARLAYWRGY